MKGIQEPTMFLGENIKRNQNNFKLRIQKNPSPKDERENHTANANRHPIPSPKYGTSKSLKEF